MTTAINFNQIPSTVNVPLFYIEVNSTATVAARGTQGAFLFGISTGEVGIEGEVVPVGSVAQAASLFGQGSQLTDMVRAYRANDRYGPLYAVGLEEGSNWRAASKLVSFSGSPTESGSVIMYVGGRRISVPVTKNQKLYSGDVQEPGIIDSVVTYVNDRDDYPFTAVGHGGDEDTELYVPLPIHPDTFVTADVTDSVKFKASPSTDALYEHKEPTAFIQPGKKYKKDPRNTETSSVYYVPSDNTNYDEISSKELTAGSLILINKNDTASGTEVINRNDKSASGWNACAYDSSFGLDVKFELTLQVASPFVTASSAKISAVSNGAIRTILGLSDTQTVHHLEFKLHTDDDDDHVVVTMANSNLDYDGTYSQLIQSGAAVATDVSALSEITKLTVSAFSDASNEISGSVLDLEATGLTSAGAQTYTKNSPVSPINYPGDVNDSDDWYIPLPEHTTAYAGTDVTHSSGHVEPAKFIQPGARYKLDPRNSSDTSVYYVPHTNDNYADITTDEYTAPEIIAVNMSDTAGTLDNPNNTGTTAWANLHYIDLFDHTASIYRTADGDENYPGDPPSSLDDDDYFDTAIGKRRGLVRWLLALNYVQFTSKWQGAMGNSYSVRTLLDPTESLPKGLTMTGSNENFTGGFGDISLAATTDVIKAIEETEYLLLATPEALDLKTNLNVSDNASFFGALESRWDYNIQSYGHGIGAVTGTHSESTVNSVGYHTSPAFSAFYIGNSATPPWECSSAICGAMITQVRNNPKLPYSNITVKGILAPTRKDAPFL